MSDLYTSLFAIRLYKSQFVNADVDDNTRYTQ